MFGYRHLKMLSICTEMYVVVVWFKGVYVTVAYMYVGVLECDVECDV